MFDLPIALIFAPRPFFLYDCEAFNQMEKGVMDCHHYASDENLSQILTALRPNVIVSFGEKSDYPQLQKSPRCVKKKWLHFEDANPSEEMLLRIGALAYAFFIKLTLSPENGLNPLVSVFTPTCKTEKHKLHRAYRSLCRQSYENWEWVIFDDSDDEGKTLELIREIASGEPRITVFSSVRRSGKIGEVKRRACALSQGEFLVELDHDDELTPNALADIVESFRNNPNAGFVYSDFSEIDERTGQSLVYPPNWAFGYGSYREEQYDGKTLLVANAPPLNSQTIRHIVGCPNHVRAWRRAIYWQIGGHNAGLHVADDFEIIIRTFLQTELFHLPKLCYLQYLDGGKNTQDVRRKEIQRLVRYIAAFYEKRIDARLKELNLA